MPLSVLLFSGVVGCPSSGANAVASLESPHTHTHPPTQSEENGWEKKGKSNAKGSQSKMAPA